MLLFLASRVTANGPFYWIILLYSLAYMPTIALSNSVAFRQMSDPGKQFPVVRVFGTVGWVISGFMIAILGIEQTPSTFYMAAIVSVGLGLFSFFLPDTPPQAKTPSTAKSVMGIDAFVLFRDRSIPDLFHCCNICLHSSFILFRICQPFPEPGRNGKCSRQNGHGPDLGSLVHSCNSFPFQQDRCKENASHRNDSLDTKIYLLCLRKYGPGIWMLYAGIILHGVCYDFFFVTGYMYTEKKSNERIKNAAQGLFTFVTYGLGMFIGTWFSGFVTTYYSVVRCISGEASGLFLLILPLQFLSVSFSSLRRKEN